MNNANNDFNDDRKSSKAQALDLYGKDSPEALDRLTSMVEASLNAGREVVTAAHRSSTSLLSGTQSTFGGNSKAFHDIIRECITVYYSTPIIRNIIDLMTDFACEGLKIHHSKDSVEVFFNNWARKTGFFNTVVRAVHTVLLTGNCIIMRQMGKIKPKTVRELSKAGLENDKVKPNQIPVGYTILNPMRLEIENSELFNEKLIYFRFTDKDAERINNPKSESDREYIRGLPKEFVEEAKKSKRALLPNDKLISLHYKKLEWQEWAFPLIFSALDDINFKKMLRQMDESSALDVIKSIIFIKLGKMEEGFAPDAARFNKLASLFKDPSSGKTILWDNLVSVESTYPPIEKILGSEKYEVVNRDILSNFGVSEILISGSSGNFSSGFLSVRTLQEKLETIREDVLNNFIIPEMELIKKALGFTSMPAIKFSSMSLRDEAAEKKLILDLVDRKIVSPETALEIFEIDSDVEEVRLNKSTIKKDSLSPFDKPPVAPGGAAKPKGKPGQGRPKVSKKPQTKKRKTKPTGIGLGNMWDRLNAFITKQYSYKNKTNIVSSEGLDSIRMATALALNSIDLNIKSLNADSVRSAIENTEGIIHSETLVEYMQNVNSSKESIIHLLMAEIDNEE